MRENTNVHRDLVGKTGEKQLRKPGRRWKKNIKVGLTRNRLKGCGLLSSDSRQGLVEGSSERDNETSGSIKCDEFYQLMNYYLLKDSSPGTYIKQQSISAMFWMQV